MLKRKIANWMYRFWYKNHTCLWEYVEESYHHLGYVADAKVKCKLCGKTTTKAELLNQNKDDNNT
jgi:hypothetical protein